MTTSFLFSEQRVIMESNFVFRKYNTIDSADDTTWLPESIDIAKFDSDYEYFLYMIGCTVCTAIQASKLHIGDQRDRLVTYAISTLDLAEITLCDLGFTTTLEDGSVNISKPEVRVLTKCRFQLDKIKLAKEL